MLRVRWQRMPIAILCDFPNGSDAVDFRPGELTTSHRCFPLAVRFPLVLDASTTIGCTVAQRIVRTPGALPFYLLGLPAESLADESCGCLGLGMADPYNAEPDPLGDMISRMARLAAIWTCVSGAIVFGEGLVAQTGRTLYKPTIVVSPTRIRFHPPHKPARDCASWSTAMDCLTQECT